MPCPFCQPGAAALRSGSQGRHSDDSIAALAEVDDHLATNEKLLAAARIVSEHRARSGPFEDAEWFVGPLAEMTPQMAAAVIAGDPYLRRGERGLGRGRIGDGDCQPPGLVLWVVQACDNGVRHNERCSTGSCDPIQ